MIGKIQLLQQLLGDQEQPLSELVELDDDVLSSLLETLQERLRSRNG